MIWSLKAKVNLRYFPIMPPPLFETKFHTPSQKDPTELEMIFPGAETQVTGEKCPLNGSYQGLAAGKTRRVPRWDGMLEKVSKLFLGTFVNVHIQLYATCCFKTSDECAAYLNFSFC